MSKGATKVRTGAVLIADEVSLRSLGATTALAAALERVQGLARVDEVLLVTDSERVRQAGARFGVLCLRWHDVGPVVWPQSADAAPSGNHVSTAGGAHATRSASGWPQPPGGTVPPASSPFPPTGTELVARAVELRLNEQRDDSALWAGLRLDVAVFVDVACPLWDASDLEAVVLACDEHGRAFLAVEVGPTWTPSARGTVVELQTPVCAELSTLRGYRLREGGAQSRAILVPQYKGWSLRDPVERVAIEAVCAQNSTRDRLSRLPERVSALVMDFDGVLTDNRVYVDQQGRESVACSRGDGLGLELLRKAGVPLLVVSKERNPVVQVRCDKLQIPCLQGVDDKLTALRNWAAERDLPPSGLVYVGNDVNDLECLEWVGCAVAVADSHHEVLAKAHLVLDRPGGSGAVRELCELVLMRQGLQMPVTT